MKHSFLSFSIFFAFLIFFVILLAGFSGCSLTTDPKQPTEKVPVSSESETFGQDAGHIHKVKLKQKPVIPESSVSASDGSDVIIIPTEDVELTRPYPTLPLELSEKLERVDMDSNSYYTNPNYWQEVYDVIDAYLGLDTAGTVRYIVEHDIYTTVILKHLEDYDAFQYILACAPLDRRGPAIDYAKRVVASDPKSAAGLEAGLYLARYSTESVHEEQTGYLVVLEHHPNSVSALMELSGLLRYDNPQDAIPLLERANRLDPSRGNYSLGIAYERLGDYKTAWIHFKKHLEVSSGPISTFGSTQSLEALEAGELITEVVGSSSVDSLSMSRDELSSFIVWSESVMNNTPTDINPFLAQEVQAHIRGEVSPFKPTRLVRAFEYIHRHGKEEGIKRIEQSDPELANKVKQKGEIQ